MVNIEKTTIFNTFARLKRGARILLKEKDMLHDLKKKLRRRKSILANNNNPFDHHRINELDKSINDLRAAIVKINSHIAKVGYHLKIVSDMGEPYLSMPEKAQILGVSLSHIYYVVGKEKNVNIPLFDLIFVHNTEFRGKGDFKSSDSSLLPFFNTALTTMMENLKKPEFKEMTDTVFEEIFPQLPVYKINLNKGGVTDIQRVPPKLKLINCNQWGT